MKQGRASISGPLDRKIEPISRAINPGAVGNLGTSLGNHATDGNGDMPFKQTPADAGRGYKAPGIGGKRHDRGSQGRY
jgi:hypothetical protein